MAQVLCKERIEEEKIIGYCSECDCKVVKSRCGCDEECPNCGEWLDWDVLEEEEEPKEYWYEPSEMQDYELEYKVKDFKGVSLLEWAIRSILMSGDDFYKAYGFYFSMEPYPFLREIAEKKVSGDGKND